MSGNFNIRRYVSKAGAILRPVLGPVIVSAAAIASITAVAFKQFVADSTWTYAVSSALLITAGTGLWLLGTTVAWKHDPQTPEKGSDEQH